MSTTIQQQSEDFLETFIPKCSAVSSTTKRPREDNCILCVKWKRGWQRVTGARMFTERMEVMMKSAAEGGHSKSTAVTQSSPLRRLGSPPGPAGSASGSAETKKAPTRRRNVSERANERPGGTTQLVRESKAWSRRDHTWERRTESHITAQCVCITNINPFCSCLLFF